MNFCDFAVLYNSSVASRGGIHLQVTILQVTKGIKMIKSVFAATAALSMSAGAAFAGPYVNVEANSGWTGSDYSGTTTDAHVGYEGTVGAASWYVQAALASSPLTAARPTPFLLVRQASVLLSPRHSAVMGEVSFIGSGDSDVDRGYGALVPITLILITTINQRRA